jgi:hypothetical protein
MFKNNGLPIMAVIRVTDALIIATNIGVSNFLSGFFWGSGVGGVGVAHRGAARFFEDGEEGSESGVIGHRGPLLWRSADI